jgi:hypothetical protein
MVERRAPLGCLEQGRLALTRAFRLAVKTRRDERGGRANTFGQSRTWLTALLRGRAPFESQENSRRRHVAQS